MTRAQRQTIEAVRLAQRLHRCHCELRAGMTRAELDTLGAGCKDPYFVCPALDAYRRRVPHETLKEEQ